MENSIIKFITELGSTGAVITIVIYFLKYIRTIREEMSEYMNKKNGHLERTASLFSETLRENKKIDLEQRNRNEDKEDKRHDTLINTITVGNNKLLDRIDRLEVKHTK